MGPIGLDELFKSLFTVALILMVLSVPNMLITVRRSRREMARYRQLREIKDGERIPSLMVRQEWENARSPIGYSALLLAEIERLNDLRPAVMQAQSSAIILLVLAIVPGFEFTTLIIALGIVAIVLISSVYASRLVEEYVNEYMEMLQNFEEQGSNDLNNIYG
ncbi:MAG: hypothetical protein PWQ88_445 [Candidatus Methanomethylophilaceae archaeon]|jgi:hypothetical protein|nr:hypothetical protein [Candidatus Methanomethylophilaceae archaeon]MDI3541174.1 hypothetical protein [Candidatus Methanomethylophilaceae archaeon]HIJ00178.1 hypothetical protein [Candidatus Methanomethylophilaceae archaeon]